MLRGIEGLFPKDVSVKAWGQSLSLPIVTDTVSEQHPLGIDIEATQMVLYDMEENSREEFLGLGLGCGVLLCWAFSVVWLPSSGVEMGNGGVVSTPPSPGRVREGVGVNGRRKLPILGVPRPYNPQFLIFRFEILVLVLVGFYTVF